MASGGKSTAVEQAEEEVEVAVEGVAVQDAAAPRAGLRMALRQEQWIPTVSVPMAAAEAA